MGGLLSPSEAIREALSAFNSKTWTCECKIRQTRGHCQTTSDRFTLTKEKTHNLSPTLCANTCVHAAQDITIQLSDTVTEEIKQKLLGYLEHVEIMFVFSFLWTTPTPSLHYSATTTPGARLHTSITEVTILPLAAVGSTAALICIWIF